MAFMRFMNMLNFIIIGVFTAVAVNALELHIILQILIIFCSGFLSQHTYHIGMVRIIEMPDYTDKQKLREMR